MLDIRVYQDDIRRRMLRKSLAIILVFSWVVLSGFDMVEDLGVDSASRAHAHDATDKSPPRGLGHPVSLVNNIIESAGSAQLFYPSLLRLTRSQPSNQPFISAHRVLELHKLHRVFLI